MQEAGQAQKCPACGRETSIGPINGGDPNDRRCVDCWFGPPVESWETCPSCGWWGVHIHRSDGLVCEACSTMIRSRS